MSEEGQDEALPQATTAAFGQIKAIAKDTVHKICSGQVSILAQSKIRRTLLSSTFI